MIRRCRETDVPTIGTIINEAAEAYRDVIPHDCWHDPYMSQSALVADIAAGVSFWGWDASDTLIGVMGLQTVADATLIRHAYVRPAHQGRGIGGALLDALTNQAAGRILVGTWAAAEWAIRFYERHGFRRASVEETNRHLSVYWNIPARQRDTSVVLVRT